MGIQVCQWGYPICQFRIVGRAQLINVLGRTYQTGLSQAIEFTRENCVSRSRSVCRPGRPLSEGLGNQLLP